MSPASPFQPVGLARPTFLARRAKKRRENGGQASDSTLGRPRLGVGLWTRAERPLVFPPPRSPSSYRQTFHSLTHIITHTRPIAGPVSTRHRSGVFGGKHVCPAAAATAGIGPPPLQQCRALIKQPADAVECSADVGRNVASAGPTCSIHITSYRGLVHVYSIREKAAVRPRQADTAVAGRRGPDSPGHGTRLSSWQSTDGAFQLDIRPSAL